MPRSFTPVAPKLAFSRLQIFSSRSVAHVHPKPPKPPKPPKMPLELAEKGKATPSDKSKLLGASISSSASNFFDRALQQPTIDDITINFSHHTTMESWHSLFFGFGGSYPPLLHCHSSLYSIQVRWPPPLNVNCCRSARWLVEFEWEVAPEMEAELSKAVRLSKNTRPHAHHDIAGFSFTAAITDNSASYIYIQTPP